MPSSDLIKELYCSTLLSMAQDHDLSKLTLAALLKETGTSKKTFYRRFLDIDDLICYTAMRPSLCSGYPVFSLEAIEEFLNYALLHRAFYAQLSSIKRPRNLRVALIEWCIGVAEELYLDRTLGEEELLYRRTVIEIYTNGVVDLYMNWFSTGMKTPVHVLIRAIDDVGPGFMKERRAESPVKPADHPL